MEFTQALLIRILAAAILLGLAVFVHEAGHFMVAKLKKVRVEKFSLGFGPRLAGFRKGDTEYVLSLIPLGGYIKMAGEEPGAGEGRPDEFFTKGPGSRIKIVLAGPLMNILLAYLLTVTVLATGIAIPQYPNIAGTPSRELEEIGFSSGDRIVMIDGRKTQDWENIVHAVRDFSEEKKNATVKIERNGEEIIFEDVSLRALAGISPYIPPKVGEVITGTPAHEAGLKAGDVILSINGEPIDDWTRMQRKVAASADRELTFRFRRDEKTFEVEITPVDIMGDGQAIIGVSADTPDHRVERYGWSSIPYALNSNLRQIGMSYRMLWLIISRPGEYRQFVGGPVMVVQMAGEEAQKGFTEFLSFMAAINIMLAIVNLMPLPVLDGGHILFFMIELARGRPVPLKIQETAQRIGLALLIFLMAFLIAQDSMRHLNRSREI